MRCLDSIYVSNLPSGAPAYIGYVDGRWATYNELRARFPRAHILSLTVFPGVVADGCDCETFDLTIQQAAGWVQWRLGAGEYRPVAYSGAANGRALIAAIGALGIPRGAWRWLSAHYGAGKHICGPGTCGYPQADGTQWRDNAPGLSGSLIDESLLLPSFFDPRPLPPPKPAPHLVTPPNGDDVIYLPTKPGAEVMIPLPAAVLTPAGPALPSVLRLSAPGIVGFEYETGPDSGAWLPFNSDAARSPAELDLSTALPGQAAVKLRVVNSPVQATADFA